MTRLPATPGERIDRDREVEFTFDGKRVSGLEGDTIGSALFAAGRRTFSRSFKYHRPRGLMCCAGQCPNCLVQVDGAPGVRACTGAAARGHEGRAHERLALARLRRDARHGSRRGSVHAAGLLLQDLHPAAPLRPLYEKVLRHAAGLGRIARSQPEREWDTEYRRRHADVLVVGGGAAGLRAAAAAAEAGADVVLCDEGPEPGGRLIAEGGHEHARELTAGHGLRASRCCRTPPRWAPSTGSSRSGRATRCTRCAPRGPCTRPGRSSSRCCSPATTCPA